MRYKYFAHLDSRQHACGGHTEVQICQHLRCGRFVNVGRTLSGEIVWEVDNRTNHTLSLSYCLLFRMSCNLIAVSI